MSKKIKDTEYLYLSAYLRAREAKLLGGARISRMLDAETSEEAFRVLNECGYGDCEAANADALDKLIAAHRAELYADLTALAPDKRVVESFLVKYDYHNAKVLVKAEGANVDGADLLLPCGRVPVAVLSEAFLQDSYSGLPPKLAAAVIAARGILSETGNPQLADFSLDRACYGELLELAGATGSEFLTNYIRLQIDCANLRSTVRSARLKKDAGFLASAFIPGGSVSLEQLVSAEANGETLKALFASSLLGDAAAAGAELMNGGSLTRFELLCDNALMRCLSEAKYVSFGVEPLIGYLGAVESELTAVRIILSGRLAGLSSEIISKRLRDTYV